VSAERAENRMSGNGAERRAGVKNRIERLVTSRPLTLRSHALLNMQIIISCTNYHRACVRDTRKRYYARNNAFVIRYYYCC